MARQKNFLCVLSCTSSGGAIINHAFLGLTTGLTRLFHDKNNSLFSSSLHHSLTTQTTNDMETTLGTTKPLFFLLEVYYHYLFTTILLTTWATANPSIRLLIQPSRVQPTEVVKPGRWYRCWAPCICSHAKTYLSFIALSKILIGLWSVCVWFVCSGLSFMKTSFHSCHGYPVILGSSCLQFLRSVRVDCRDRFVYLSCQSCRIAKPLHSLFPFLFFFFNWSMRRKVLVSCNSPVLLLCLPV